VYTAVAALVSVMATSEDAAAADATPPRLGRRPLGENVTT